jgi:YD repeat-containing protein
MSDRKNSGLHGPVRTCVEETILPDGKPHLTTTEYDPDGRLLTFRNTNSEGTGWGTAKTYEVDGRLTRTISGNSQEPGLESVYTYDGAGRLVSITNSPYEGDRIDFHFDEQGRKTSTQRFGSKTFERARTTAYAVSAWEAANVGGGVPIGGSIVSIYDGHDEPTEARVLDSAGQTLTRFVRTFDANGRVVEVNQELENPGLMFRGMFSDKELAKLDDKGMETLNRGAKAMLSGLRGSGSSYSYDAHGRIVETRERNFAFEKITTILYNAQGDRVEERRAITNNCTFPAAGVSIGIDEDGSVVFEQSQASESSSAGFPSLESEIHHYSYQYDGYGNWVEQTINHSSRPDEPLSLNRRKLIYY